LIKNVVKVKQLAPDQVRISLGLCLLMAALLMSGGCSCPDTDGDGYSQQAGCSNLCIPTDPPDCNDSDPLINPEAVEILGNVTDENCDGSNTVLIDSDSDGLVDSEEVRLGTDRFNPDTDGDKVLDGEDNCKLQSNPFDLDSDRNGEMDKQSDTDGDGLGDICDSDDDDDGILDEDDNCIKTANPDQADQNNNGKGDPCDWIPPVEPLPGPLRLDLKAVSGSTDITDTWLPEAGNSVQIEIRLLDSGNNFFPITSDVTVGLTDVSAEPGRALNEQEDCGPDFRCEKDASFEVNNPDANSVNITTPNGSYQVYVTLYVFDYGATATIAASTHRGDIATGSLKLPRDTDHDGVPDVIERRYQTGVCQFNPENPYSFGFGTYDGDADPDISLNNGFDGDGIWSSKEWRGVTLATSDDGPILYDPDGSGNAETIEYMPNLSGVASTRLDLCRKTLFVRGDGFANSFIDQPDPGRIPNALAFITTVNNIIAPRPEPIISALEEIDLQVLDVTGLRSNGWSQSAPNEPPNVDILVVTYNTWSTSNPPCKEYNGFINQNSSDLYDWDWDEMGCSCIGNTNLYGHARTDRDHCGTYVNHLNTLHYFYNRPFQDSAGGEQGFLDETDTIIDDWENLCWGDTATEKYKAGKDLSVFDRDGDGYVENPHGEMPSAQLMTQARVKGEYSPQHKVTHTVFHEIFHALGVGPGSAEWPTPIPDNSQAASWDPYHSNTATCLMHVYSVNWSRAGHVCDWVKGQVLVHNATEEIYGFSERPSRR